LLFNLNVMFTVKTAEIRWFFKGNLPWDALKWFEKACSNFTSENERTDTYLVLPDTHDVGIKVRQGRVEIKKLIREPGKFIINKILTGKKEIWGKWSFPIQNPGNLPLTFLLEPSQWISVVKTRKLSRFAVEQNSLKPINGSDPYPGNGVHLELTELELFGVSWWTLGAESYGNENLIEANLDLLLKAFFDTCPVENFDVTSSMGYPAWLARNV